MGKQQKRLTDTVARKNKKYKGKIAKMEAELKTAVASEKKTSAKTSGKKATKKAVKKAIKRAAKIQTVKTAA